MNRRQATACVASDSGTSHRQIGSAANLMTWSRKLETRTRRLLAHGRSRASRESGQSLVVALVVTGALTISVAAIITYMTSNESAFGRDRQADRALNIAEAGLNNGLSVLANVNPNNSLGSWSTPYTASVDGGQVQYSLAKSGSTWTITATGTSPNGKVTRQLQESVNYTASTTTVDASAVYGDGIFVNGTSGCTNVTSNATVKANIWVNNSLCLTGNINLVPATSNAYSLYVGGQYSATGNIWIGTSPSALLSSADIVGGCNVVGNGPPGSSGSSGSVVCSTSAKSHIYASSYSSSPSSGQVKPTVDAAATYALGKWNTPNCTTGSFTFDTNGTKDRSAGSRNLFPSSSYNCTIPNASGGGNIGSLAWNNATGTLTVSGTVFIDGDVNFVGNVAAHYTGNGTIYVNGVVNPTGNISICGPPNTTATAGSKCSKTWDPTQGQLAIVALNPTSQTNAFNITGNQEWDIVAFAVGTVNVTGNAGITGPVIADGANLTGNFGISIPASAPSGSPSTTTTTVYGWKVVPGSWKELK